MKAILIILAVTFASLAHQIKLYNNCPFTVWPGLLGNPGKSTPENGGFKLDSSQSHTFSVDHAWGGRIWPRRDCDNNGHCVSGDCGNRIQCNGAGGVPPVTLAEFTFDGWGDIDYYDVSLVDGYNLPVRIKPLDGTFQTRDRSRYDCGWAGCNADLNAICPDELSVWHGCCKIACKSACLAFDTDQYCCRGAHGTPDTCKSSYWPKNYPAIYKQACPDAYSYAYDDETSTFTCKGNPVSGYEVIFCP